MRRLSSRFIPVLLALLVLAEAGAAQGRGQGPPPGRGPGGQGPGGRGPALLRDSLFEGGPIALLLTQRDSLRLSAGQVVQLRQLDAELQQRNQPLVHTMLQLRKEIQPLVGKHPRQMTVAEREQFSRQAARARPVMQQLQENNRRAMERVSELLTPDQKRWVRERLRGPGMGTGPGPGRAPAGGQ